MKKSLTAAIVAASCLASSACRQARVIESRTANAQSENGASATASAAPIDGVWKTDVSTIRVNRKPDRLLLQGGQFSCLTCIPPLTVAADGAFHAVTGRPYADHIAVKTDDGNHVTRLQQKNGHTTATIEYSVSPDGKTLTVSFTDSASPNTKPVTGTYAETRVAAAPIGAHAISGSWKQASYSHISDDALTATFRERDGTLHLSTASGQSYDARLDGSDTPIRGDIGGTTASVRKLADNVYQETDKRDGKAIGVMTMTVADGKMTVKDENKQNGAVTTYVATKQ
jgi:hypothetical protein